MAVVRYNKHDHYLGHFVSSRVYSNRTFWKLDLFPSCHVKGAEDRI